MAWLLFDPFSTAEPVYGFPPRLMTSQKVRTPWEGGFSYHHPAQLVRLRCGGTPTLLPPAP